MTKKEAIAERAYQLWIARGRAHGSEEEDWLEAERQMSSTEDANELNHGANGAVDAALGETFPASDPVASHLPDEPPSNAQEKWDTATQIRRTARPSRASE